MAKRKVNIATILMAKRKVNIATIIVLMAKQKVNIATILMAKQKINIATILMAKRKVNIATISSWLNGSKHCHYPAQLHMCYSHNKREVGLFCKSVHGSV